MKKIVLVISLLLILFSCAKKSNNQNIVSNKNNQKDTNITIVADSVKNQNSTDYIKFEDFEFSYVIYEKYFVISNNFSKEVIKGYIKDIDNENGVAMLCNIDLNSIPEDLKKYVGKTFMFYTFDGDSIKLKIKELKAILQGTPHFGQIQTAENDPNPKEALKEVLLTMGAVLLVGEIEADENFSLKWGQSTKFKNYKSFSLESTTDISDTEMKLIYKIVFEEKEEPNAEIVFKSKNNKYFISTQTRQDEPCGPGSEYDYQGTIITKIENNQIEIIYDADHDELLSVLDIYEDGFPEFIFKNNYGKIYMIQTKEIINNGIIEVDFPFGDCGC